MVKAEEESARSKPKQTKAKLSNNEARKPQRMPTGHQDATAHGP
jgi:hypothetical protein